MKRTTLCSAVVCVISTPLVGQQSDSKPAAGPRVVQVTIHPAAEPRPALKYLLLPDFVDQVPGNAAPRYFTASLLIPDDSKELSKEQFRSWAQLPLEDLPREKARQVLGGYRDALREAELGAFREVCDWEYPIRSEGFSLLLPGLARQRALARALALRARLNTAEGRCDEALRDLQMGFAMARHTGESPLLISGLVGIAIGDVMKAQVETLIGRPDCPNLYWALTNLPRPFVDIRKALAGERAWLLFSSPACRDPRKVRFTAQQWDQLFLDAMTLMDHERKQSEADKKLLADWVARVYPKAKQYLLDQGMASKAVEAMPEKQAILVYLMDHYHITKDDYFKWLALEYWQAHEGLARAEKAAEQLKHDDAELIAATMLPSLTRAYYLYNRLDQGIAALRCIEAIRMYAANHDGKLPTSLADITEVPIPIDPITGKAFRYKLEAGMGVLECPPPPGALAKNGTRYELTIPR